MKTPRICFFAKVADEEVLRRVEFYAVDIRILRSLGYDVHVASRLRDLVAADCYFVWWWGWAFAPAALARALRGRTVVTGVFDIPSYEPRSAAAKFLMRLGLRLADVNVFCSAMEMRDIPARFRTTSPRYVPLSVDTELYRPGAGPRGNTIFSVGWLQALNSERKGMPDLIRAAPLIHEAHPEVQFVIAGQRGTHYPVLKRMAEELGAERYVHFAGAIPVEEKIRMMQECRVYLQPTRHEGFGVAILEAMSCGAPVVTRPVGAVSEVVGDAAAFAADGSPQAIADAVIRLLDDPESCEDLGRRARARAEAMYPYRRREQELKALLERVL